MSTALTNFLPYMIKYIGYEGLNAKDSVCVRR